jgi:hypothetical protein
MVTFNGSIVLNGVTDKEMERIWGFKSKHGSGFSFTPNIMQPQIKPDGTTIYNNVSFQYNNLQSFNLISEIVNDLHKKEETAKAASL